MLTAHLYQASEDDSIKETKTCNAQFLEFLFYIINIYVDLLYTFK